jgi:hypothetical protein
LPGEELATTNSPPIIQPASIRLWLRANEFTRFLAVATYAQLPIDLLILGRSDRRTFVGHRRHVLGPRLAVADRSLPSGLDLPGAVIALSGRLPTPALP